jgi:hypothetical protein
MNPERLVIESMYDDVCNVYEYISVTDLNTNITKQNEVTTLANQKCRLSYKVISSAKEKEIATVSQSVKLFISPEVDIKPNSKISITHCGRILEYSRSGLPAIYDSHQEIILEPFRGYA